MTYTAIITIIINAHVYTIAGEDYIYNRNQITVDAPPGVASQSLTINIFDDNIVECIEKFNVTLISVTTCGVTIGSNRISEVTIRDDDGKYRIFRVSVTLDTSITINQ